MWEVQWLEVAAAPLGTGSLRLHLLCPAVPQAHSSQRRFRLISQHRHLNKKEENTEAAEACARYMDQ